MPLRRGSVFDVKGQGKYLTSNLDNGSHNNWKSFSLCSSFILFNKSQKSQKNLKNLI